MTPRPPQSEEPTLDGLNAWLDKTDRGFKLAKVGYCPGCGLTPSEFKQHLATIIAQERTNAVRDFGEKLKKHGHVYDMNTPHLKAVYFDDIDRLVEEDL